jgi:hypothetical protein
MKIFYSLLAIGLFSGFSCQKKATVPKNKIKDYNVFHEQAIDFCNRNDLSTDYYFLIDMSIHSGKNRFFVYDFIDKKVTFEKLVTHGSCDIFEKNLTKWEKAKFSNKMNSHCSAKGKFKTGKRESSKWGIGIKYWLIGLEQSNSNSEKRVTVMHSWNAVSDTEIYPNYNALSWGCPAVSDNFMTILDKKLQKTEKPVLLWIID